jgi:hypothetical protein
MPYASAYSNLLYDPKQLQIGNNEWIGKIVDARNLSFDEAYKSISSLRNQALNINLYNIDGQKRVDQYNQEINKFYEDKDLAKMDLADFSISNKFIGVFDKISSDQSLSRIYKKDVEIKNTMEYWNQAAKNPSKSGYSKDNHIVWMNENMVPYTQAKVEDAIHADTGSFLPKYDYTKDITALMGEIKVNGTKYEIPDGKGGKQIIDITEISPERLKMALQSYLPKQAIDQIAIEGKASFYNLYGSLTPEKQDEFARAVYQTESARNKSQLDGWAKVIEINKGKISASKDVEYQKQLTIENSNYQGLIDGNKFNESEESFVSMPTRMLAQYLGMQSVNNKFTGIANSMSPKLEKRTTDIDPRYWKDDKSRQDWRQIQNQENQWALTYQFNKDKEAWDQTNDVNKLETAERIAAIKAKKASGKALSSQEKKDLYFSGVVSSDGNKVSQSAQTMKTIQDKVESASVLLSLENGLTEEDYNKAMNVTYENATPAQKIIKDLATPYEQGSKGYGYTKELLNTKLKGGELREQINAAKSVVKINKNLLDQAWNAIAYEYQKTQSTDPGWKQLQADFKRDPSLMKVFYAKMDDWIKARTSSVHSNLYILNTDDTDIWNEVLGVIKSSGVEELKSVPSTLIDKSVTYGNGTMNIKYGIQSSGEETKWKEVSIKTDYFPQPETESQIFFASTGRDEDDYSGYKIKYNLLRSNNSIQYDIFDNNDNLLFSSGNVETERGSYTAHFGNLNIDEAKRKVRENIDKKSYQFSR